MDNGNEPARQLTRQQLIFGLGGTLRPADSIAYHRRLPPLNIQREVFETANPVDGSTHRANTPFQIKKLADRIGSSGFTHVAVDGTQTLFEKVDGEWKPSALQPIDRVAAHERAHQPDASQRSGVAPGAPHAADVDDRRPAGEMTTEEQRAHEFRHAHLQQAAAERYVIDPAPPDWDDLPGTTDYCFRERPTMLAFTETRYQLHTHTNLPSVARSMVDIAELRGYGDLDVRGDPAFARAVWREATLRGVKVIGYEPNARDLEELTTERGARATKVAEPARGDGPAAVAEKTEPPAHDARGRNTVMAAIDAVLLAQRLPDTQRAAVLDAAAQLIADRVRDGQALPKVRVYDSTAPSQWPAVVKGPEPQITREQAPRAR